MKNKALLMTIIGIFTLIIINFVQVKFSDKEQHLPKEVTTIGILQYVSHPALDEITQGIYDSLVAAGYEDGRNAKIIFQNAQADQSKLLTMSQQLISQKPDVLIGIATPSAQALANATSDIPIILGAVTDPVGARLVKDANQPGGNITGVSDQVPVKQQIDLLKALLPEAKQMGILYSATEDNAKYQVQEAKELAEHANLVVHEMAVPSTNEIQMMMQTLAQKSDVIYLPLDNTIANAMETIVAVANKEKIPLIVSVDTMLEQGGLAMVGINQYEMGEKIGQMTSKLLAGQLIPAKTAIETVQDGVIAINGQVAKALEITIPENLKEVTR